MNQVPQEPRERRGVRALALETLIVAATGLTFALAANALSPRGLRLNRNYFPNDPKLPRFESRATSASPAVDHGRVTGSGGIASVAAPASTNVSTAPGTPSRLAQRGLATISSNEVLQLFKAPGYQQELIVFIDARNDKHYEEGHIPGAWQFDHYHMEKYLPEVLPACMNAQKVVVYCTGGACEDSEFAAMILRDAGIRAEKICVYEGGITEWKGQKLPIEAGARRSGRIMNATP